MSPHRTLTINTSPVTQPTASNVLLHTEIPGLPLFASGKVRDIFKVDDHHLLFVASDRISAFDYVLASGIPKKGEVLTQLSLFWFSFLKEIVPNHLTTADVDQYPDELQKHVAMLRGRSMLVARAEMIQIECVVRGYLSGSGWKEYKRDGAVCGIKLPAGLKESDKLPEPIFTPASKAQSGHDENISFEKMCSITGVEMGTKLRDLSLNIYRAASEYALTKGIIIADTKFEFGLVQGRVVLADEVLTPDSSRFWPVDKYQPGKAQESFDKQYVRDYLEQIQWNKQPPAPGLPAEVAAKTSEKYVEAYRRLTGHGLPG